MKVKWEFYQDPSYFDMWAVRPIGDKDFDSPRLFHVKTREIAITLTGILNDCDCAVPE